MLAMVVSESSFGAYVCLTRPAGSTATSALVDVSVFMSNSPIEQELSICKTTRLFVGSSPLSCGLKPSFTKICKLEIFCFAKPPYRRVSHGLGLPANAILFLPFVKGNQKLRNTSAPTVSIAHQTDLKITLARTHDPMLLSLQIFVPPFPWLNFPFPCFLYLLSIYRSYFTKV